LQSQKRKFRVTAAGPVQKRIAMELYHNNMSVCAQRVRLAIHEKGCIRPNTISISALAISSSLSI
jgi:hypothetical protein